MAFTYCTNCGEKIDMSEARCPHCGYHRASYTNGDESRNAPSDNNPNGYNPNGYNPNGYNPNGYNPNGYNPNGYNPNGYNPNGYNPNGYNPNGYNPNGYNPNGYNPNGYNPMYRMPIHPVKRQISVGLLIFSIINIAMSLLFGTSIIFGIIALVYTVKARDAQSEAEEIAKKKKALIINIVGIVIGALSVVAFFALFSETVSQMLGA